VPLLGDFFRREILRHRKQTVFFGCHNDLYYVPREPNSLAKIFQPRLSH
jgi:hypothetical protein